MQKIQITNFGPIDYAEVEIKDLVIFIGEQASGKSTISKLIYFFKTLKEDYYETVIEPFSDYNYETLFIKKITEKFFKYFGLGNNISNFKIKFFYNLENAIELSLDDDNLKIEISDSFIEQHKQIISKPGKDKLADDFLSFAKKTDSKYEEVLIKRQIAKYLEYIYNLVSELFDDDKANLFVPAGRNITTTYSDQFKLDFFGNLVLENNSNSKKSHSGDVHLMLEFLRKVEGIKDSFKNSDFDSLIENELKLKNITQDHAQVLHKAKDLIFQILKGKYQHDSNGEKIVFNGKNNRAVSLNNASSGQQESIRILQDLFLILLNKEAAFRVIEEPEAHLYPMAQKQLIELIGMVLKHTDSQVLITTHSPYILSVVNNLVFANRVENMITESPVKIKGELSINQDATIKAADFQAYSLANGEEWEFISIFDEESQLIDQNYLDKISQIVGDEFNATFQIYKQLKPRNRQQKTN